MKLATTLFALCIIIHFDATSQSALKINAGLNISNSKRIIEINNSTSDTTFNFRKNITLPYLNLQKQINISKKTAISFGLGVAWGGAKNYNINIPSNINIDPNFVILPISWTKGCVC